VARRASSFEGRCRFTSAGVDAIETTD
jgi:hypothetical protein